MSEYDGRQFVGIDLHRRRSLIVRTTDAGEALEVVRINNDLDSLTAVIARAGEAPEVVLEATYGWYWAVDALQAAHAQVHLAHPLGVTMFQHRRVKNDVRDAADLADLLRMGRLPEAWITPPPTRQLRELVRHRAKLVALRSGCKCEVHAVLAKLGVQVPMSDLFTERGLDLLAHVHAPAPYVARIQSLQRLIDALDEQVALFARLAKGSSLRIRAIGRSRRSRASGRSWRRCSSPRSATCTGSPRPPTRPGASWGGHHPGACPSRWCARRAVVPSSGSRGVGVVGLAVSATCRVAAAGWS